MADDTPPSPTDRSGSPSAWASPSLAISAVPQLDRSVSTASSVSSVSGRSSSSRLSDSGIPGRRRGYMRPEGTVFSQSAKSRDSVMNLGTIAHLQYYFARTGLLDGKGAQLAKARKNGLRSASGSELPAQGVTDALAYLSSTSPENGEPDPIGDGSHMGEGLVESPVDDNENGANWAEYQEPVMLPPTVSTYKETPVYVPPPPDMVVLRRELRESMEEALKHLCELEKSYVRCVDMNGATTEGNATGPTEASGWHEIEGLNLLDVITLAIRAAKNYYTAHENTQRLYSIKSERQIRRELYDVLDVLKRLAMRNFVGGIQAGEVASIKSWVEGIGKLLDVEEEKERLEQEERDKWSWREGDWSGREREREWLFLRSFNTDSEPLPEWKEPGEGVQLPTSFLQALQNGLHLVHLHNELVRKSRRQFEEIKQFHTDTAKPYRCADNLRYWIKAADLRWDVKLDLDVMGVVYGTDDTAWRKFDEALLKWSQGVREGIIAEWKDQKSASLNKAPTLQVDPDFEAV